MCIWLRVSLYSHYTAILMCGFQEISILLELSVSSSVCSIDGACITIENKFVKMLQNTSNFDNFDKNWFWLDNS